MLSSPHSTHIPVSAVPHRHTALWGTASLALGPTVGTRHRAASHLREVGRSWAQGTMAAVSQPTCLTQEGERSGRSVARRQG